MDNIIYTYGGGEALTTVLNGVAMLFNSNVAIQIISLMTVVAISWAAILGIIQQSFLPKINWMMKYALITTLLINPKGTIWVTDTVTGARNKVDNLPIGLILPASLISTMGYGITTSFEQAFNTVDNIAYSKYGTAFAASLISQSRNYKIQDSVFRENMESFIDNCVLYDVMIGRKYTVSDLRDSTDIWQLIGINASNIKMFNYRDNGRTMITCKEGVSKLNGYFETDIKLLSSRFKDNKILDSTLLSSIDIASKFFKNDSSATNTIKQLMLINALNDMPASYGVVRAKHQQYETWKLTGELARENLPIMHAVFAALIYASFCLILGLLVMPGGFQVFGSYLGLLAWIELWPPLFAVLNLIVNLSSKVSTDLSITMNNVSQIVSVQGNISSLAGYLMASIPFISYAIIKGGAGHFVHLAGQLTSATQGAASSMSQEVTSGNRSFDNKSFATSQMFNASGFKTDINASYRSGHQEYQQADGTVVKETANGNTIFHAGPGVTSSVGSRSIAINNASSSQAHQSISMEKSLMDSKQIEYSSLEQNMTRNASEFVERLASGKASGEHYNYGQNSSDSKILSDVVDKTKEINERYGYGWSQTAEVGTSGGAGLRFGAGGGSGNLPKVEESTPESLGSKVGNFIKGGFHAELGANAGLNRRSMDDQTFAEQKGIVLRKGVTENLESVVRAAKEMQFNSNQSEEKAMAESLTGSYEKMQAIRDSMSVHQQNINRYQESIDHSTSTSFATNDDLYHKELEFISGQKDKYGFAYGTHSAQKMIEHGGGDYNNLHQAFMSKYIGTKQSMPNYDRDYDTKSSELNRPEGINTIEGNIDKVNISAKLNVENEFGKSGKIDTQKMENVVRGNELQNKVNDQECSRIAPGFIGQKRDKQEKLDDY